MQTVDSSIQSNILIIGHQSPFTQSLEVNHSPTLHQALTLIHKHEFSVIALYIPDPSHKDVVLLLKNIEKKSPETQKILITPPSLKDLSSFMPLINDHTFFKVLFLPEKKSGKSHENSFNETLKSYLQKSLEKYALLSQNNQLFKLVQEQNKKLEDLSILLDKKIKKRQKYLTTSREKLLRTNSQIEALHRALIALQEATSISDLESLLHQALSSSMNIAWIRILFQSQNLLENQEHILQEKLDIFSSPIVLNNLHVGQIYFAHTDDGHFSKEDHNFLLQVTDAVLLSIDRLSRLEDAEGLKQQWESTFDAISNPLSLINSEYRIVRCNQSFAQKTSHKIEEIIGKKCHQVLFGQKHPCISCPNKQNFFLPQRKTLNGNLYSFEVNKQKLDIPTVSSDLFVVFYHDRSEQKKLEQQLLESAKMAELGTISSSIAHELNNPLGGIISFLQLIKMDMKKENLHYEDIVEMENGAMKCKEIIQDLLSYSRKQSLDQITRVDLRSVIRKSIKMSSLEFKNKPVHLRCNFPKHPVDIDGQINVLTQAIQHLLQSLFELNLQSTDIDDNRSITLDLTADSDNFIVLLETSLSSSLSEIKSIFKSLGLNFEITNQIIAEHTGNLEFFSQSSEKKSSFQIKITFPRPESGPENRPDTSLEIK